MSTTTNASADWVGSTRTKLLAWWLPHAALIAGLLVVVPARAVIWIVALAWMGVACILNPRRCGRTHCRFAGPYYLVTIIPAVALGLGVVPVGLFGWLVLGAFVILCGKTNFWATERAGEVLVERRYQYQAPRPFGHALSLMPLANAAGWDSWDLSDCREALLLRRVTAIRPAWTTTLSTYRRRRSRRCSALTLRRPRGWRKRSRSGQSPIPQRL